MKGRCSICGKPGHYRQTCPEAFDVRAITVLFARSRAEKTAALEAELAELLEHKAALKATSEAFVALQGAA